MKDLGEIQPTWKWYSVKVLSLEHVSQSDCYMFIFHNFLREYSFQQPDNMSICHWPDIAIVTCTFHGMFFFRCVMSGDILIGLSNVRHTFVFSQRYYTHASLFGIKVFKLLISYSQKNIRWTLRSSLQCFSCTFMK